MVETEGSPPQPTRENQSGHQAEQLSPEQELQQLREQLQWRPGASSIFRRDAVRTLDTLTQRYIKEGRTDHAETGLTLLLEATRDPVPDVKKRALSAIAWIGSISRDEGKGKWFAETLLADLPPSQRQKLEMAFGPATEGRFTDGFVYLLRGPRPDRRLVSERSLRTAAAWRLNNFLALDRPMREAICWRELEWARHKDERMAAVAGEIAWRIWREKTPLLERYLTDVELAKLGKKYPTGMIRSGAKQLLENLTLAQRDKLTDLALEHYSDQETAEILDRATEEEIERRAKRYHKEENPAFRGKKVSVGVEIEMGEDAYSLAIIYGYRKAKDQLATGETPKHWEHLQKLFSALSEHWATEKSYRQAVRQLIDLAALAEKIPKGSAAEVKARKEMKDAIAKIKDQDERNRFEKAHRQARTKGAVLDLIAHLSKHWIEECDRRKKRAKKAKDAYSKLLGSDIEGYCPRPRYGHLTTGSTAEEYLEELYTEFAVQAQHFGHNADIDAVYEHALNYVPAELSDPYSLCVREIFEMAKLGLLDFEHWHHQPLHITIGWEDLQLPEHTSLNDAWEEARREASSLNAALIATGWTDRSTYRRLANELRKAKEEKTTLRGTAEMKMGRLKGILHPRYSYEKRNGDLHIRVWGAEFRSFAPISEDLPRTLEHLGWLGTAMKAILKLPAARREELRKLVRAGAGEEKLTKTVTEWAIKGVDETDTALIVLWANFKEEIAKLYEEEGLPPADAQWSADDLGRVTLAIAENLDKRNGFVAKARRLVREASKEVKRIKDSAGRT